MSGGIDSSGFTPKPNEDIKTDLEGGFRAVFGAAITVIAQSIFGQIIGIVADRFADLWQLGLALYNGSTREGAVGVQLDNIGALTGSPRKQATFSKVDCQCLGTNGTVIAPGQIVSIPGTGNKFTNDAPGTISGGTVTITFRCTVTGPVTAFSGTVVTIETPVAGWSTVVNALDQSVLGANVESDPAYRIRQVAELRAQGASTVAAIRAKIVEIDNVTGCFVFENVHDTTDGEGLPPHSFECVVAGGLDADIAFAIATFKPVGVATYGSTTVTTTDANGFPIAISFSRPVALNAYVTVNLTALASTYPINGDALVKAAIEALSPTFGIGVDLRSSALIPAYLPNPSAVTATGVPGVVETALPLIGTSATPTLTTTIVVGNRQQIVLDTSRIVVNHTLV